MPLEFYFDEHVPKAITTGLRARGVDVLTAQEDGRKGDGDTTLLARATELDRVLFTRDDDFFAHAKSVIERGGHICGLVYAHQLRVGIGQCVKDLELMAKASDPGDMRDRIEMLPLGA